MKEYLIESKEELKRADHLIYVSLKYTRTVDVIKRAIDRLISTMEMAITGLLNSLAEKGKIGEVPPSPLAKCALMKKLYANNPEVIHFVDFFIFLRQLSKAEFSRAQEFRRHVTMSALLIDKYADIDIDVITDYYHKVEEFLGLLDKLE